MCARGIVHPQALPPMKVKGEVKSRTQQEKDDIVQDADFAADFTGPKLTSDGTLCACGDHSIVPISWLCKKTDGSVTQQDRS